MEINDTIIKRAKFFMDKKLVVHISLKNFKFYNGLIVDINNDFLIIIDEKLGESPVFFNEIYDLEAREEKRDLK